MKIDYDQFDRSAVAVLAAISLERGVDEMMIFKYSVNKDKFKVFLDQVRAKYPFDDICFYMDNLRVHTSREIADRMDELGFAYVFSPAYSPDLNPIETIFSLVKSYLKR